MRFLAAIVFIFTISSCQARVTPAAVAAAAPSDPKIVCGAERMDTILPVLQGKRVALMVNQTSLVGTTHLVDTLLSHQLNVVKVFAPEHGFRGTADAGEHVNDTVDAKTGVRVISLYGDRKKPSPADLTDVDIIVFDIQDVGARFYTYISSLHYLMEACAENDKPLLVLDRPNPNGSYVNGPVMKPEFSSFVGVDPIPVVHGLTVAEYARMVNGEKWMAKNMQCKLQIITCQNYNHKMRYSLPVKPSPNLPNDLAIEVYPYICFFEGTNVSVGRGTDIPFQVIGSPNTKFDKAFEFTPQSKPGAKSPPFLNVKCYGYDLRDAANRKGDSFMFRYVVDMYRLYGPDKSTFFLKNNFFDKLCGTDAIRKMIMAGSNAEDIEMSFQQELDEFKARRKQYLLYE